MYLRDIELINYKNYPSVKVEWVDGINCLVGLNGTGKTNMLDAIYYCCMTKSRFSSNDRNVMRRGGEFVRIKAHFDTQATIEELVVKMIPSKRKEIELDGGLYSKLSNHIGKFPIVIIAPSDTDLVWEGSEARRRFLNNTLCQTQSEYLHHLQRYNKLLKQRNALLKEGSRSSGDLVLDGIDRQMEKPAHYIHDARKDLLEKWSEHFYNAYAFLSADSESVLLEYKSPLTQGPMRELLQSNREKDWMLQRTSAGIHKDDIRFIMDGERVKGFSSQGQTKSFILSLKLMQYAILRTLKGVKPLLLLDDIFDKLDHRRVQQLIDLLSGDEFGQVFISDTEAERVKAILSSSTSKTRIYQVDQQNLIQL